MPYVKSIPLRSTVNRSLAYILNPDKTEDLVYTTALNCIPNAKDAYLAMKRVYEQYSGKKFNEPLPEKGKGSVKAIHYIQSFAPDDNVTPELAHRIAKAFARKTFGDDCQIVIATHVDKKHIHTHFIVNTYTLTGRKFNDNKASVNHIREYSDRVCLAFGIQPIPDKKGQSKTIAYNEWENKKRGTSWKQKIRLDIDRLIGKVKNIDELVYEMELLGYSAKRGKYISFKPSDRDRFVRTKTLGDDYTVDSLVSRILWKDAGAEIVLSGQLTDMQKDYSGAITDVRRLAAEGRKIQRKRDGSLPYSPDNDMDVYKLSAQLTIINRDNIGSIGELRGKIDKIKSEYETARRELNELTLRKEKMNALAEAIEMFNDLSGKTRLSVSEKLQLDIYSQTLKNNNLSTAEERERFIQLHSEINKKITVLESTFKNCKSLCDMYSDIAATYERLKTGDYIADLVDEQRKKTLKEARKI